MAISDTLKNLLTPIFEASTVAPYYGFANPNHPMIRALLKDGLIVPFGAPQIVDPNNAKQAAYQVTDKGAQEFPAFNPQEPNVEIESEQDMSDIQAAVPTKIDRRTIKGPRGPRGPNAVRSAPIIHKGVRMALPASTALDVDRRKTRTEKYPFASLEAPDASGLDSFFVQATDELPNPAKMLGSNVNKANKKYPDRNFVIRTIKEDAEFGVSGARVFRDR